MDFALIILRFCCILPLGLLTLVLGPPTAMHFFSRIAAVQEFGNRHWRIRLGLVIALGLMAFTWVHVSIARIGADASMFVYGNLADLPGTHFDASRQAVVRELWARWIIPGSDSGICYLKNDTACASINRYADERVGSFMEQRGLFALMNPLPAVGIASGMLVALVAVIASINQLVDVNSVEITGAV